jgi:hypothetical protein
VGLSVVIAAALIGSFILYRPSVRKARTAQRPIRRAGAGLVTSLGAAALLAVCIAVTGLPWWVALLAIPGVVAALAVEVAHYRSRRGSRMSN